MNVREPEDGSLPEAESGIAAFLQSWRGVAAALVDRHLTVLGSTPLAEALFPNIRVGINLARAVFLEGMPGASSCADDMSYQVVAALHSSLARNENDPEFEKLVGELSTMSREFSTAWAADRRRLRPHGTLRATHPLAGELEIWYQLLELAGSNDVLIVWRGADTASECALERLVVAD